MFRFRTIGNGMQRMITSRSCERHEQMKGGMNDEYDDDYSKDLSTEFLTEKISYMGAGLILAPNP